MRLDVQVSLYTRTLEDVILSCSCYCSSTRASLSRDSTFDAVQFKNRQLSSAQLSLHSVLEKDACILYVLVLGCYLLLFPCIRCLFCRAELAVGSGQPLAM